MNMHASPTISRIFADRYRREATRLERLHANHIAPGTKTWGDAMEGLEARMSKLGGPIKRTAAINRAAAYLRSTQRDGMHFILGTYATKRSSVLSFASVNFGPHPLAGVEEDGVSIMKHTIVCRRDGTGWTLANHSLGYISRHAIQRLHERSGKLTIDAATKMFTCIGMLGHLIADSDSTKHIDGTMSLQIEDMLATGMIRFAVSASDKDRAKGSSCIFFEVRTFLPVEEMVDGRAIMGAQGRTAYRALERWIKSDRDQSTITGLVDEIPSLPGRSDDFVLQRAIKG